MSDEKENEKSTKRERETKGDRNSKPRRVSSSSKLTSGRSGRLNVTLGAIVNVSLFPLPVPFLLLSTSPLNLCCSLLGLLSTPPGLALPSPPPLELPLLELPGLCLFVPATNPSTSPSPSSGTGSSDAPRKGEGREEKNESESMMVVPCEWAGLEEVGLDREGWEAEAIGDQGRD